MEHLQEQTVLDFLGGALDEAAASAAHEHVDSCQQCRELVAFVGRVDHSGATDDTIASPTRLESPRSRRPTRLPVERIDEYQLGELLGRGGMGAVYLAQDTLLDRPVAIKLISLAVAPEQRRRLLVEARAAARIKHPNVVTVYRVGETDGQPYVVYELIPGKTLQELARPTPWPKVVELAVGVARGLAAAHEVGVLHRDIKPGNIMLSETGEVVLLDFGLAKIAEEEPAAGPAPARAGDGVTAAGVRMGTPRYMSPEAWRGEAASPQSDIYSLGVVLFELSAGRGPFGDASGDELAHRAMTDQPASLRQAAPWVPPALADIVDRCLRRDPGERFGSATALRAELESLQTRRALEAVDRLRARGAPPTDNPYRGPAAFRAADQAFFFGRRAELAQLVDRLQKSPFVLVAGDAGVGKTSLCRAGLLPLVTEGALGGPRHWAAEAIEPGRRPLAALAAALGPHLAGTDVEALARTRPDELVERLRRGHGPCSAHLLLVDGLEQLVTEADPEEARITSAILGLIARPSPTLRLVATVRTDHITRVAALPGLDAVIGPAAYILLPPRSEEAVREIITGPAALAGGGLAPRLVDTLVAKVTSGELGLAELQARLAAEWTQATS
jgi:hypothetical protein